MNFTFGMCVNLTGEMIINANPDNFVDCLFYAALYPNTRVIVKGKSNLLNEIIATKAPDAQIILEQ